MRGYIVLSLQEINHLEKELLEKRKDSFNGLSTTVIIHIEAEKSEFNGPDDRTQFSIKEII